MIPLAQPADLFPGWPCCFVLLAIGFGFFGILYLLISPSRKRAKSKPRPRGFDVIHKENDEKE